MKKEFKKCFTCGNWQEVHGGLGYEYGMAVVCGWCGVVDQKRSEVLRYKNLWQYDEEIAEDIRKIQGIDKK